MSKLSLVSLTSLFLSNSLINTITVSAHPCYSVHEEHCGTMGPSGELGVCIQEKGGDSLTEECKVWLKSHKECAEEVGDGGPCQESAYTQDVHNCLQDWTPRDKISSQSCKDHLTSLDEAKKLKDEEIAKLNGAPQSKKEKKAADKRKAQRKRIREEAVKRAKKEKKDEEL